MESSGVPKSALTIVSAVLNKFRRQCTVIFQIAPFIRPDTFKRNLKDYGTTALANRVLKHFPSTDNMAMTAFHIFAPLLKKRTPDFALLFQGGLASVAFQHRAGQAKHLIRTIPGHLFKSVINH